jgi:hypothetical protein
MHYAAEEMYGPAPFSLTSAAYGILPAGCVRVRTHKKSRGGSVVYAWLLPFQQDVSPDPKSRSLGIRVYLFGFSSNFFLQKFVQKKYSLSLYRPLNRVFSSSTHAKQTGSYAIVPTPFSPRNLRVCPKNIVFLDVSTANESGPAGTERGICLIKVSWKSDKDPVPVDAHRICRKRAWRSGLRGIGKQSARKIRPPDNMPVPDIEL